MYWASSTRSCLVYIGFRCDLMSTRCVAALDIFDFVDRKSNMLNGLCHKLGERYYSTDLNVAILDVKPKNLDIRAKPAPNIEILW